MRRIVASTLLLLALGAPAGAEDALPETELGAIRGVIEGQLQAFRDDDGRRAYGFAAPGIQLIFPNAEVFMAMVRDGYTPVYRSAEIEFRDIDPLPEGRWLQQVLIVGMDGSVVLALYTMERQPNGMWKIAGCTLAKSNEATT